MRDPSVLLKLVWELKLSLPISVHHERARQLACPTRIQTSSHGKLGAAWGRRAELCTTTAASKTLRSWPAYLKLSFTALAVFNFNLYNLAAPPMRTLRPI